MPTPQRSAKADDFPHDDPRLETRLRSLGEVNSLHDRRSRRRRATKGRPRHGDGPRPVDTQQHRWRSPAPACQPTARVRPRPGEGPRACARTGEPADLSGCRRRSRAAGWDRPQPTAVDTPRCSAPASVRRSTPTPPVMSESHTPPPQGGPTAGVRQGRGEVERRVRPIRRPRSATRGTWRWRHQHQPRRAAGDAKSPELTSQRLMITLSALVSAARPKVS